MDVTGKKISHTIQQSRLTANKSLYQKPIFISE